MPEVADIFRRYGEPYLAAFGQAMLPSHRRAFDDIVRCRTSALGGQLYVCDHCGRQHYAYHSCRNRSCPKCHGRDIQAWLASRKKELLPVHYFHVVFTVPADLRRIIRRHQKRLYGALLKAAAKGPARTQEGEEPDKSPNVARTVQPNRALAAAPRRKNSNSL
jgi:hypothetical protein